MSVAARSFYFFPCATFGSTNVHSGYGGGHRLAQLPHSPDSSIGSSSTPGSRQAGRPHVGVVVGPWCAHPSDRYYSPRSNYYVYVKRALHSRPESVLLTRHQVPGIVFCPSGRYYSQHVWTPRCIFQVRLTILTRVAFFCCCCDETKCSAQPSEGRDRSSSVLGTNHL